MTKFENGELFVYTNGDRWELGMVKRPNNSGDGYFCWYSRGDTAANTPTSRMHKLSNDGFTHIEQLLDAATVDAVPETKYLMALDEAREAQRKLEMCQTSQKVYQSKCRSLKETNADLRRISGELKAATADAGTCQIETTENWLPAERYHRCKHCGAFFAVLNASHDIPPHVCPNCGRRIEVSE